MPFDGKKFQERRVALGLSQNDVAQRTLRRLDDGGIDMLRPEYVSTYETGRRQPGADALLRLAEAVGCDPRDFWVFDGKAVD